MGAAGGVATMPARKLLMFGSTIHLPDQHNLVEVPCWRWQRAGYLLDHGRQPLPDLDDAVTGEAWLFRKALTQCHTDADHEQLARNYPGLAEAHAVYTGDRLHRAELEARLLAGSDDFTVAGKLGLSPAAASAYHDLYFDVRPHLNAHAYVLGVVLGGKPFGGLTSDDHETILKTLGYQLGEEAVDAVLDFFANPPVVPASLDRLSLPELKQLCDRLRVKVAVLLLTTPAKAAWPETWQWLGGRFSAEGELLGDDEEALDSTHGLLDAVTEMLVRNRPDDAAVA
jgi:hypothetical protein